MSKTTDLRRVITEQLNVTQGETYYRRAPDDAVFPYKTFTLSRVNLGDLARDDFDIVVDIWDHATNTKTVEEIADQLEQLLNASNLPQAEIFPTFYRDVRITIDDADKDIQHLQLTFLCQLYTKK